MKNILIASFKHETNTSSPYPADLKAFHDKHFSLPHETMGYYRGTRTELGGFIDTLADTPTCRLCPSLAFNAEPCGPVTQEVMDLACHLTGQTIREVGQIDGVLLALHGAMVTENSEDGEGDYLEFIRSLVGDEVPIIVTLDLHANITEKMVRLATALINYDTYPHVDAYERGVEAAQLMAATLAGRIRPVMAWRKLPFLPEFVPTHFPCVKKHIDAVLAWEVQEKVLTVSIGFGFFCADIYEAGLSVIAVTDGDRALAQQIADQVSEGIWADRALIRHEFLPPDEAIDLALATEGGPVVFSDGWDNPGGGSPGDGTHILRRLLERKAENVAIAYLYDPETVERCIAAGAGQEVDVELGGKMLPHLLGTPICCRAYVRSISDGRFIQKGNMGHGLRVRTGPTVVLQIEGAEVIVGSLRMQPYDAEIFAANGINVREKKIVVLKSANHFRTNYESFAARIIDVKVEGGSEQQPRPCDIHRARRPIYPLDNI